MGPSVPKIFRNDFFFSREWDHLCARYLEMIFSREWDHLCPRHLEMISFFTRMGPSVPKIFRDDFFTPIGPSVPKIFRDDFFTRMGPSVPEILRGDVSPKWDHLCPKRKILHRGNS